MDHWRVIRVGRKIRLKRMKIVETEAPPVAMRASMVITHRVKVKPPKALRRMLSFWR